jgi:acetyl-CoA carboxylase carboxyltransferase component
MSKQTEKIKQLVDLRAKAREGGGQKAIDKQHARGKYTARERIAMLLDEGSFEEMDMFKLHRCTNFGMEKKQYLGDGVVAGSGTIDGRLVFLFAQDFTVNGGSLSETMAQKICKVMDMAMKMGAPCIGINDSGGARIQEGINALGGFGEIFQRNIEASGVIPQISGIFGPCAGGAVYSPALTDFILMMENTSYMFLTGPKVVKTVTGEDVTQENLGGASVHSTKSGVCHFTAATEEEAMQMIRTLISYIPQNNMEEAPRVECNDPINRMEDSLNEIIPDNPNEAYDMYKRDRRHRGQRRVLRGSASFRSEHHNRFRTLQRPERRRGGQPAYPLCRCARLQRIAQGRPFRTFLRRLQYSTRYTRGRSRFPAGYRSGVQRRHSAWSETALRLRRSYGAQRLRLRCVRATAAVTS